MPKLVHRNLVHALRHPVRAHVQSGSADPELLGAFVPEETYPSVGSSTLIDRPDTEPYAAVPTGSPCGRRDGALHLSIRFISVRVAFSKIACAADESDSRSARRAAAAIVAPCS